MIDGVRDTHAALWYLFADSRLSVTAKAAFDTAVSSRRKILLFVQKNRLPASAYADLKKALRRHRLPHGRGSGATPITFCAARRYSGYARSDGCGNCRLFWRTGY